MAYRILVNRTGSIEVVDPSEWTLEGKEVLEEIDFLTGVQYESEREAYEDVQRLYAWVGKLAVTRWGVIPKQEFIATMERLWDEKMNRLTEAIGCRP